MAPETLWTVQQLADYLDVSKHVVYSLTRFKAIPCFKVGKQLRFFVSDVQEHFRARAHQQQQTTKPVHTFDAKKALYGTFKK